MKKIALYVIIGLVCGAIGWKITDYKYKEQITHLKQYAYAYNFQNQILTKGYTDYINRNALLYDLDGNEILFGDLNNTTSLLVSKGGCAKCYELFMRIAKEKNFKYNIIVPEATKRDLLVFKEKYRLKRNDNIRFYRFQPYEKTFGFSFFINKNYSVVINNEEETDLLILSTDVPFLMRSFIDRHQLK